MIYCLRLYTCVPTLAYEKIFLKFEYYRYASWEILVAAINNNFKMLLKIFFFKQLIYFDYFSHEE